MKIIIFFSFFLTVCFGYGQQTIYDTITYEGLQRSYILYVPASYSANVAVPLVFNFHGYTSDAYSQMNYGDFRPIADTADFLVVHPMGTNDLYGQPYWDTQGSSVDDIGFIDALIDTLALVYNIDLARVYSTGMSNGGILSYWLACELSNRFAAIASVAGSMNTIQITGTNLCSPQHPTPVLEIHGTADGIVSYTGSYSLLSIENTLQYWVNFNGCDTIPIITNIPDIDLSDSSTVEHYVYKNGSNGVEVEHYKIIDGGHTWPGSAYPSSFGNTNQDINASVEIWNFFARYNINGLITSGINPSKTDIPQIKIYPNPTDGNFTIEGNNIQQINVTDITGRIISNIVTVRNKMIKQSVDLSNQPKGIYFVRIKTDTNVLIEKIILN